MVTNVRPWPIVLKKSGGNFFSDFLVAAIAQLTSVQTIAPVLDSRVTALSFPCRTRAGFFNTIDPIQTFLQPLD
jgi:hypothetical protein